ncbi:MAG TPA: M81 family metallopeptidase [archaeon]|nr:M81 family metallopeptidase [archaeon]
MSRVLLANLAQETCSFVQSKHTLDDFRRYYLYTGQEIIEKLRGGGMEVSAFINAAEEEGIELVPLLATYGGTGGPVTTAAYAYLRDEIFAGARRSAAWVDGAILALHGAMLTEELDDPEGDLLAGLRQILGPSKPIVCSLDCHAHMTDLMVHQATAFVAYQTHPHVDIYDTGYRAMKLFGRAVRGEVRPVMAHRKLRMIAPPEQHNTSRPPMGPIMQRVKDAEKEPGMLAAAIFPVQPQLDVPNLGWSVLAMADGDPALARAKAEEVGKLAWQHRREFLHDRTPIQEALRIARETPGGPIVLADASDGTAGGAEGDSTVLLQALLESPVPGPCLLLVTDPEAVAVCAKAGVGAEVTLEVGGKLTPAFFRSVRVTGRIRTLSDGRFQMKLPPIPANRGLTAVLQVGEIFVVLSEKPIYTWDEECYRSVGLFPREAKVVQVKSPGGFRPIYEPFARAIIDLDAPGPTDSNLVRLPYRRVTRPLFPLDDI